jgi:hypothetical protein
VRNSNHEASQADRCIVSCFMSLACAGTTAVNRETCSATQKLSHDDFSSHKSKRAALTREQGGPLLLYFRWKWGNSVFFYLILCRACFPFPPIPWQH